MRKYNVSPIRFSLGEKAIALMKRHCTHDDTLNSQTLENTIIALQADIVARNADIVAREAELQAERKLRAQLQEQYDQLERRFSDLLSANKTCVDKLMPGMEHIFTELRIMREVLLNREGLVLLERDVATETSTEERPRSALERLQKSRGKLV